MTLAINTATSQFSITATGLALDIAGQRLSGNFTFEQAGIGTARVVKVAATNVELFLGDAKGTGNRRRHRPHLTGGRRPAAHRHRHGGRRHRRTRPGRLIDIRVSLETGLGIALQINTMPTAAARTFVVGVDHPRPARRAVPAGAARTTAAPFTMAVRAVAVGHVHVRADHRRRRRWPTSATADDVKVLRIAATNGQPVRR